MKRKSTLKKYILPLFIITYSLFITSCYSWYETKVPMTEPSTDSLNDLFENNVEVTLLEAPQQLFVSQGANSGTIDLSWSPCENATSYRIEKAIVVPAEDGSFSLPTDDEYEILQKYVYSTSYSDVILKSPSFNNDEYKYLYFYRVCSDNIFKGYESSPFTATDLEPVLDADGNATEKYDSAKITPLSCCGWLLPAPNGVEAGKGKSTTEISLQWNAVPNARYYKIYRGQNSNGTSMEQIDIVLGNVTSYTNTMIESEQGVEFYYKVSAQLASGVESAFSSLALGYSLKPGAPETPQNIKTINSLGQSISQIQISWDAVNYIPTKPTLELTYSIYRTSSVDSVYTLIKNKLPMETSSFTDTTGIKPGVYYYYYLQSIATDSESGEQIKSAFSETGPNECENPVVGFLLSCPNNVEVVTGSSNNINVRWTPAIGSEMDGITYKYNIYGSDIQDGPYDVLLSKTEGTLQNDGYLEASVTKKQFYKISTFYEAANLESALSEALAPCPDAPVNVVATKCAKLDDADFINKANSFGVYPVKITWEKPTTDNPAGYHVYRSTSPDSDFRKITTTPVQELSYVDNNETAKAGIYYYYKVVSVNMLGQGKYGNNPSGDDKARGYGILTGTQFYREYNKTLISSLKKLTYMNKSNDMDKLGTETVNGAISGNVYYNAGMSGYVTMTYTDYCDFYINNNEALGKYIVVNGNTDTEIEGNLLSKNGHMKKSVEVTGMYKGTVVYNNVEIKSGAAGGGYYLATTKDLSGAVVEDSVQIDWKIGEEGK